MTKVLLGLCAALLVTIIGAKLWFDATAATGSLVGNQPWTQNEMEFVAWNGKRWTAWIRDGAFEQLPQDQSNWSRHAKASLAFIDWEGETWQAKIEGDEFLLAYRGDWQGPIERSKAIRYRDWQGDNQLRTVAQLRR